MFSAAVRRPVPRFGARASVALRSLLCALGALLAASVAAAPARAVPVGDPFQPVSAGREPDLTFNPVDARYLLSVWSPSRGGFSSARVVSVAAAGDPDVRTLAGAGPSARTAQIAHDPVHDRFLLAYFEEGFLPGAPPRGVTVVLYAADGRPLAGPTLISPAGPARPQVAYNSRWGEYLVVSGGAAQRVSADGVPLGAPAALSVGAAADVAYRRWSNDYLVVSGGLVVRLSAAGTQLGAARRFDAGVGTLAGDEPAIAVRRNGYRAVVTWGAQSGVYARELVRNAKPGRMRQVAPTGRDSAVAYNPSADEYLVLWAGSPDAPPPGGGGGAATVRGQHLTGSLREIGPDDFRVSSPVAPPPGFPERPEFAPAVAADTTSPGYLAAWNVEYDPIFNFYLVFARRMTSVAQP